MEELVMPLRAKPRATQCSNHEPLPTSSRLLSLPPELQFLIWEFVVISPEPLNLNCPCDSSYGGWTEEYYGDRQLWLNGSTHAPLQPSLTKVCRSIRADALPMFYKYNTFIAGYCYETDMKSVVAWLRAIGTENRRLMRKLSFIDANRRHDVNCPKDLKALTRGKVVREMNGVVRSEYSDEGCRHRVSFADKANDEEFDGLARLFADN